MHVVGWRWRAATLGAGLRGLAGPDRMAFGQLAQGFRQVVSFDPSSGLA